MIELTGKITLTSGMWVYTIYQRGAKFYLEEQSEMMEEPTYNIYSNLSDAITALVSRS